MRTVQLKHPIEAHGEKIGQITLRAPKGKDITECGYPFLVLAEGGDGAMQPIAGVISKYISRLGNIPPSSVDMLEATDWHACMQEVLAFFGGLGPTSSTASSTSPGSGGSRPANSSS